MDFERRKKKRWEMKRKRGGEKREKGGSGKEGETHNHAILTVHGWWVRSQLLGPHILGKNNTIIIIIIITTHVDFTQRNIYLSFNYLSYSSSFPPPPPPPPLPFYLLLLLVTGHPSRPLHVSSHDQCSVLLLLLLFSFFSPLFPHSSLIQYTTHFRPYTIFSLSLA